MREQSQVQRQRVSEEEEAVTFAAADPGLARLWQKALGSAVVHHDRRDKHELAMPLQHLAGIVCDLDGVSAMVRGSAFSRADRADVAPLHGSRFHSRKVTRWLTRSRRCLLADMPALISRAPPHAKGREVQPDDRR